MFGRSKRRDAPPPTSAPQAEGVVADAVLYLARHGIEGAVVQCGTGDATALAHALVEAEDADRELYLFDAFADAEAVRAALVGAGYPEERTVLVDGDVAETIPDEAPARIALLRLDTDWYESTKHELEHLLWRISPLGILLLDGYDRWPGGRRAVDESLETYGRAVFLAPTADGGRIAVLP